MKSARKILFFQHSCHNGGAPRSLHQIVEAYENDYGPQTVLFIRSGPVLKNYTDLKSKVKCGKILLPFHGSEVSGMNWKLALRNLVGLLTVPGATLKYLRGYDVVYLNSSSLCFYGLLTKIFSPRTKIIYHVREPLLNNIWGKTIRWSLRKSADYVFAISKNEHNNLRAPELPGEVVYNYVHSYDYHPERGRSLHRADKSVGSDRFVVGYFARLDVKNGIVDFLEIAKKLENRPDIAFCIYGHTGDEKGNIQDMIANCGDNVRIYPMVSDVPRNLVDINVLLVPFRAPHFSRSVIEAAMLKVPSIIYDIASVNETVVDSETGYIVPLGDTSQMIERILQLSSDPSLYEKLSEGAHNFAIENFSEKNYARIRDALNS